MVEEDGPTGTMRLSDKMSWMNNIVGEKLIDAIIWPASRHLRGTIDLHIVKTELKTNEHERLHDKIKLVTAIHELASELITKANSGH